MQDWSLCVVIVLTSTWLVVVIAANPDQWPVPLSKYNATVGAAWQLLRELHHKYHQSIPHNRHPARSALSQLAKSLIELCEFNLITNVVLSITPPSLGANFILDGKLKPFETIWSFWRSSVQLLFFSLASRVVIFCAALKYFKLDGVLEYKMKVVFRSCFWFMVLI